MRFSKDQQVASVVTGLGMMFSLALMFMLGPGMLPLLVVAAPFCFILATLLLREILLQETAYQYRKPPVSGLGER